MTTGYTGVADKINSQETIISGIDTNVGTETIIGTETMIKSIDKI